MTTKPPTPTYSRKDYINKQCSHREYYAQFVTEGIKTLVHRFHKDILRSEAPHFNDIPLEYWDRLSNATLLCLNKELWRAAESPTLPKGSYPWSLCANTCILKEAAQQVRESHTPATQ
jgi:hypothetical protein